MTASQKSAGRSRLPVLIGIAVVAVVALGIGGVVYMFTGSAPAEVSLASSAPSARTTAAPTAAGAAGSLDGTWNVDTSVGSFSDFSASFVGYRVNENLANVGSTVAVGRTPKVSGSLTFAGNTISAVKVTADLSALQSDKPMRDGQLHRQALETDQFPTATFELTSPIQLPSTPADGQTVSVTAQGKLTLHGVTKDVSIPLEAKLAGNTVTVVGSLKITFADYSINPPQSMVVLSVDNFGQMELQLNFTKG